MRTILLKRGKIQYEKIEIKSDDGFKTIYLGIDIEGLTLGEIQIICEGNDFYLDRDINKIVIMRIDVPSIYGIFKEKEEEE